ncbi:MAG: hypothetical protein OXC28_00835, partial [Defluviicoccus sp.]|nr:hypothetical protein [Defluviicoccus sp.]
MGRTLFGNQAGGGRRLAAWLAPLLVLALWAAEAKAQSTVLVSNIGQSAVETRGLDALDFAQKFTTGATVAGYTLTGVDLRLVAFTAADTDSAAPRVRVVRGAATGGSSVAVATLTAGTTTIPVGTGDNYAFTAPANTTLLPSTDYWIVVEAASSGGGDVIVFATNADSEDTTSAAGWSIDDGTLTRAHDSTGAFTEGTIAFLIRVNGSSVNTPATGA